MVIASFRLAQSHKIAREQRRMEDGWQRQEEEEENWFAHLVDNDDGGRTETETEEYDHSRQLRILCLP